MQSVSRWNRIEEGMTFDEVKDIFGEDMWSSAMFGSDTWLVSNEADSNSNHGYMITFDENMRVKCKGSISIG